ncbi:hypothetical protein GCM10010977_30530 [Citricoccus zhacaiensis]|uniref:Uncharacterized protein n=2 Tax=Citricoccus zhacaiensis TaxID=489142 RepID=A0ABQ2MAE6_9MICC|nr:hypothetical protein GCM10010977_30530 [Citricoccus zhacaiensis]
MAGPDWSGEGGSGPAGVVGSATGGVAEPGEPGMRGCFSVMELAFRRVLLTVTCGAEGANAVVRDEDPGLQDWGGSVATLGTAPGGLASP